MSTTPPVTPVDAGRVYRDQLSDPDQGRASFESALAADPHSAGALRALAGLLAAEGRALLRVREWLAILVRSAGSAAARE